MPKTANKSRSVHLSGIFVDGPASVILRRGELFSYREKMGNKCRLIRGSEAERFEAALYHTDNDIGRVKAATKKEKSRLSRLFSMPQRLLEEGQLAAGQNSGLRVPKNILMEIERMHNCIKKIQKAAVYSQYRRRMHSLGFEKEFSEFEHLGAGWLELANGALLVINKIRSSGKCPEEALLGLQELAKEIGGSGSQISSLAGQTSFGMAELDGYFAKDSKRRAVFSEALGIFLDFCGQYLRKKKRMENLSHLNGLAACQHGLERAGETLAKRLGELKGEKP